VPAAQTAATSCCAGGAPPAGPARGQARPHHLQAGRAVRYSWRGTRGTQCVVVVGTVQSFLAPAPHSLAPHRDVHCFIHAFHFHSLRPIIMHSSQAQLPLAPAPHSLAPHRDAHSFIHSCISFSFIAPNHHAFKPGPTSPGARTSLARTTQGRPFTHAFIHSLRPIIRAFMPGPTPPGARTSLARTTRDAHLHRPWRGPCAACAAAMQPPAAPRAPCASRQRGVWVSSQLGAGVSTSQLTGGP